LHELKRTALKRLGQELGVTVSQPALFLLQEILYGFLNQTLSIMTEAALAEKRKCITPEIVADTFSQLQLACPAVPVKTRKQRDFTQARAFTQAPVIPHWAPIPEPKQAKDTALSAAPRYF
jgi:histone H3/H4